MKLNNPDQAIKYNLTLSELLLLLAFSLFDKKLCCLYMIHYKHLQICHFVICRNKNWDHIIGFERRRLQNRAVECRRKVCISSGCILDMSSHQSQHSYAPAKNFHFVICRNKNLTKDLNEEERSGQAEAAPGHEHDQSCLQHEFFREIAQIE